MRTRLDRSGIYVALVATAAVAAGVGAWRYQHLPLGIAAGAVLVYALHLVSLRAARSQCRRLRVLERLLGELAGTHAEETIVSRRFSLGAVALIEGALDAEQVFRALVAERSKPGTTFRDYVLERGYLEKAEVNELIRARREARYVVDQIRIARRKVEELRPRIDPDAP